MSRRLLYLLPVVVGALLIATAALLWPQAEAAAQCGSQASSCKNCHEVQANKPVNNDGKSWHASHAFGDFCANCHGGNIQSTDQTTAHTGMIAPLSDIKANCAACHPNDTQTKAQTYATLLGVSLTTGDQSSGSNATSGAHTPAPTPTGAPSGGNAVVTGLVDYNQQYAQTVQGQVNVNWGNIIAAAVIVLLAAGGGAFVFYNERRLRATHKPAAAAPQTAPVAAAVGAGALASTAAPAPALPRPAPVPVPAAAPAVSPDLSDLVAQLQKLDPPALRALRRITADPVAASELLVSLSRIDPHLIEAVRHLDRRELNLLMALAEEH